MFGKISSVSIMKNSEGNSRGFGFVNFASADDAGKALETLNGTLLGSKKLFVGRAQMKAEREEMLSCNSQKVSGLFVKNLAKSIDENQLEKHFNACGRVTSVKIMRCDNGVSKGFGFVHFSSPEGARKALATLNGTILQGKPLFIAIPRCKEETQRVLPSYCAEYPVSSLCSSSWDVSSLQFNPLLYNLPYDPLFTAANYHQPIAYQTFLRNADTLYPWTPEIYSHDISTCVSTRQMWQQNNKGWTCQYQSTARDQGNRGRWNSGFRKRGYRRGSMEYCTKGPSVTGHTGGMTGKNMSEVLNPLDQNLQLEDARKTKGMLLEMNNCDLIKLLNSPKSLAFHVDKAVRAQ